MIIIQSEQASTPKLPKNVNSNLIVPFEANFEEDELSDMDLLSAISRVQEEMTSKIATIASTTVSNTSNLVPAAPKAMFAYCHIGAINITINKNWHVNWWIQCKTRRPGSFMQSCSVSWIVF